MILLKQKRKTYTPPEIEVTEYEEEVMDGGVMIASVYAPDPPGDDDWAKSYESLDDFEDDDICNDFDYHSYMKEQLW